MCSVQIDVIVPNKSKKMPISYDFYHEEAAPNGPRTPPPPPQIHDLI
jgi:hypothetical protein